LLLSGWQLPVGGQSESFVQNVDVAFEHVRQLLPVLVPPLQLPQSVLSP
jgi:hypothetical protein